MTEHDIALEDRMSQIVADLLAELSRHHDFLKETWKGASQECIDWKPGPETNSLAVLAVHVAGSERFWIGDLATGRAPTRNRDAEFLAVGLSISEMDAVLDNALADSTAAIESLSEEELLRPVFVNEATGEMTPLRAIVRTVGHVALHVGHAQLTRQLYEQHYG